MNLDALIQQLKTTPSEQLESETLEFKAYRDEKALHNSKDLAEEISALANKRGGFVVIGVKDSSDVQHGNWEDQLQGIDAVDELETQERLQGKLQPKIQIVVKNHDVDSTNYVTIETPHRSDTLVSTTSGKICIREGRSSRPMTPDEIQKAVKSLTSYDWSAEPLECDASDVLDSVAVQNALSDFCKRRGIESELDTSAFLEAINATKNGVLLNGGLLFLGKPEEIRNRLGDFEFRFSWKTPSGQLKLNDVWNGNIWNAIKQAKQHFAECNEVRTFEYDGKEFDVPHLDNIAFHEAFLNALVHRDYSSEGMTAVTFTGSKMLITSPGAFFGGVTAENIGRHEPRHRNKALARILMVYHLVDRAGMGVLRMGLHSLRYGRAFPEFRDDGQNVEVSMDAEFLRPGVTVLVQDNDDKYGIPELMLLNCLYQTGYVDVSEFFQRIHRLVEDPWMATKDAVKKIEGVELCGDKNGVYVRVTRPFLRLFDVSRLFRAPSNSDTHVKLYSYLMHHGSAPNSEIQSHLGHKYKSYTSKFLSETKYVTKTGHAAATRWTIGPAG